MQRRVVITGTSSAGKTTLAQRLAARQRLHVIDLDDLYWLPGWVAREPAEFRALVAAAAAGPGWAASGNYRTVRDLVWAQADTIVWLDYPFALVLWRGVRRALRRIITRETLPHGNRETFRNTFLSRDSILLWIITTYDRRRREMLQLTASGAYPQADWVVLRHPRAAEAWLRTQPAVDG
jgi:adenylate kinase family enzyme